MSVRATVTQIRRILRAPDTTVIHLGKVTYRGDLVEYDMILVP